MDIVELKKAQAKIIAVAVNQIAGIHELASTGQFDRNITNYYLQSLFRRETDEVDSLIGTNEEYLQDCFKKLKEVIANPESNSEISSYVKELTKLAAIIALDPVAQSKITQFLDNFKEKYKNPIISDIKQNAEIAEFFVSNIRPLAKPAMRIYGSKAYLIQEHNTALIRTLLLSTLRLIYMYIQMGGQIKNVLENIDYKF